MIYCPECGGVIGRDCFNPSECAMIGEQMRQNERHEMEQRIGALEQEQPDTAQLRAENESLARRVGDLEGKIEGYDNDLGASVEREKAIEQKLDTLRAKAVAALEVVLGSAYPQPKYHPKMFTAWEVGRKALAELRGVEGGK